jgi:hypothetical protein
MDFCCNFLLSTMQNGYQRGLVERRSQQHGKRTNGKDFNTNNSTLYRVVTVEGMTMTLYTIIILYYISVYGGCC